MLLYLRIELLLIIVAFFISAFALQERKRLPNLFLFLLMSFLATYNVLIRYYPLLFGASNRFIVANISMLVELAFYFAIFYSLLQNIRRKFVLKILFLTYLLFTVINAVFIQALHTGYQNYSFVLGSVFILVGILFYFIEQLNGDGFRSIFNNFWFWYSAALFIFLATEIPFMSILNHYLLTNANIAIVFPVVKLKIIVSSFYYLSFSIAYFLCRKTT